MNLLHMWATQKQFDSPDQLHSHQHLHSPPPGSCTCHVADTISEKKNSRTLTSTDLPVDFLPSWACVT